MKAILFTDTHFGCKNASRIWFKYQCEFFREQVIPYIKKLSTEEEVVAIHLGDVFDARSTLNTMIAHEVRELFKELAGSVQQFYIIPGNHDYFSEQSDEYCSVNLVLGGISGLQIINKATVLELDGTEVALIPWHIQKMTPMTQYTQEHPKQVVFTHADIVTGKPKIYSQVFSGHIHTPWINEKYYNLGSCFPLDFHDSNQMRYFYIWDPNSNILHREANKHSIRFWRKRDQEILDWEVDELNRDDYIELYISSSLLLLSEYQSRIEELKSQFRNLWVIPVPEELANDGVDYECDIDAIIEQSIPEELQDKFNYIKEKINECAVSD